MRITNITGFLIAALYVDEVSPFSFFGKSLGKRRSSSLKSSEDKPAFFATEVIDVSIPYDAAARLAYESSNKTMAFERFKTIYLERAVELVKFKQPGYVPSAPYEPADVSVPYDAAAKLAYETSETRLLFEAYKKVYIEEMVNMVTRKNNERKRQQFASKFTPKPPVSPPPVPKVVDKKFAEMVAKFEDSKDETCGRIGEFVKNIEFAEVVKNIEFKKPEMQEGVPEESIKGAALLTAGLALLSTKGVIISSAAGLSAAYASMQRGQVGDVFRTFGGATWDATEAATQLVRAATADERVTGLSKELAAKVTGALEQYQDEQLSTKTSVESKAEEAETKVTEGDLENSPELVAQFLEEVEAVIDQADAAMALADETLGKADMKLDAAEDESDDSLVEKEEVEFEEITSSASDEALIDEPTITVDDEEQETFEPILDAVEDIEEDEEEEEEVAADEFDDEWAATLELAQEGIGGKIIGMDEVINDAGATADWEAAGKLAEDLVQESTDEDEAFTMFDDEEEGSSESEEDIEDMMPEGDLEAIARAAREAVEMSGETVEDDDSDEDIEDMMPEGDLDAIALAAREAVEMSGETVEDDDSDEDIEDMMPEGDLEAIARAAREAVEMSGEAVEDDDSDEDIEDMMPEGDLDAIALAAREAVEMSGETVEDDDSDEDIEDMMPEGDLDAIALAAREAVAMSVADDDEDDEEEVEDMLPEGDLEDLARAAREAVAMSGETFVDDEDEESSSDSDLEAVDDMMPEGDLEEIARAAREAVAQAGQDSIVDKDDGDDDEDEENFDFDGISGIYDEGDLDAMAAVAKSTPDDTATSNTLLPLRDWSKLTVNLLREECKVRGIRAYGRKVELIAKLEEYELKLYNGNEAQLGDAEDSNSDDSDWELEFDDVDLAALGEQARAAVQAYEDLDDDDDDDDDVEDDAVVPEFPIESAASTSAVPSADFSKMTVLELKDELRNRGLKVSGRKAELIDRLQSALV